MLDHRSTDGISDELVRGISPELPPGAGQGMFEAPTITCSHCQVVVVINPARIRERAYCAKCNHYICDGCGAIKAQTGECKTFNQVIEEIQEKAAREEQAQQRGIILLNPGGMPPSS